MSLQAQNYADDSRHTLGTMFRYQYIINRSKSPIDTSFTVSKLGENYIHTHEKLSISKIIDYRGAAVAYCIGIAVDEKGICLSNEYRLEFERTDVNYWNKIENFVIGLAGRFLIISHNMGSTRIYGDLSNSMSCVYDPESGNISSSILLCLDREIKVNPIMPPEWAVDGKQRYCFGNTNDKIVKRLSANYYLDVSGLIERRFWPKGESYSDIPSEEIDSTISMISHRLSSIVGAITDNYRTSFPLRGGSIHEYWQLAAISI